MLLVALAILVLTVVGYFLFFKEKSQSECSSNVAVAKTDTGAGVTGSDDTEPPDTTEEEAEPGVNVIKPIFHW
jgi:hypothetical protein